jgi:hypothetical protein
MRCCLCRVQMIAGLLTYVRAFASGQGSPVQHQVLTGRLAGRYAALPPVPR